MSTLYHVTRRKNVSGIWESGLLPLQPTNWVEAGSGERYGDGRIYAFEKEIDAYRWAARWDWEENQNFGTNQFAVVEFQTNKKHWDIDTSDPITQSSSEGRWLKTYNRVPPEQILRSNTVGPDVVERLRDYAPPAEQTFTDSQRESIKLGFLSEREAAEGWEVDVNGTLYRPDTQRQQEQAHMEARRQASDLPRVLSESEFDAVDAGRVTVEQLQSGWTVDDDNNLRDPEGNIIPRRAPARDASDIPAVGQVRMAPVGGISPELDELMSRPPKIKKQLKLELKDQPPEPFPGPPPWHWNCRSTLIPILKSFNELDPDDQRKIPVGKRSSMNGHVAGDLTYDEWFKTLPEAQQREILGDRKYELWKKGALSMRDMIDQSGNPLNIDQLEALVSDREGKLIKGKPAKLGRPVSEIDFRGANFSPSRAEKLAYGWNEVLGDSNPQVFIDMMKDSLPEGNVRFSVAKNWGDGSENRINVSFDGDNVRADRYFWRDEDGNLLVDHSYFKVHPPGGGIGKRFMAACMDVYESAGVEEIKVHANIDVGGYAWARFGFVPEDDTVGYLASSLKYIMESELDALPADEKEFVEYVVDSMMDGDNKALWKLADSTLGKDFLLNSDWTGFFNLNDTDQMDRFNAYVGRN